MAMNPTAEDYTLPCGRDVETLWQRLDEIRDGPAGQHELGCPHCIAAMRNLDLLRELTTELAEDGEEPSLDLTGRIMAAVRADVRRHDMVPLPATEPGEVRISKHAVAAVLRSAADSVAGVRSRRCRVRPYRTVDDENAGGSANTEDGEVTVAVTATSTSTDPAGPVEVELSVAVSYHGFARQALDLVRNRVATAATARLGLRLERLDLLVEDLYDD